MNPAAHRNEDNASAPVLYMALELSNKSWRLTFGGDGKRRQVSVAAADLMKLLRPTRPLLRPVVQLQSIYSLSDCSCLTSTRPTHLLL